MFHARALTVSSNGGRYASNGPGSFAVRESCVSRRAACYACDYVRAVRTRGVVEAGFCPEVEEVLRHQLAFTVGVDGTNTWPRERAAERDFDDGFMRCALQYKLHIPLLRIVYKAVCRMRRARGPCVFGAPPPRE